MMILASEPPIKPETIGWCVGKLARHAILGDVIRGTSILKV
jgi:hypothetical protein